MNFRNILILLVEIFIAGLFTSVVQGSRDQACEIICGGGGSTNEYAYGGYGGDGGDGGGVGSNIMPIASGAVGAISKGGGNILPRTKKSIKKKLQARFSMGVNAEFAIKAKFGGSNSNSWGQRTYGDGWEKYDKHSNNFYWEVEPSFSVGVNAQFSAPMGKK